MHCSVVCFLDEYPVLFLQGGKQDLSVWNIGGGGGGGGGGGRALAPISRENFRRDKQSKALGSVQFFSLPYIKQN